MIDDNSITRFIRVDKKMWITAWLFYLRIQKVYNETAKFYGWQNNVNYE